jgi:hypothetical protein
VGLHPLIFSARKEYEESRGVKGLLSGRARKLKHIKSAYDALRDAATVHETTPESTWVYSLEERKKYDGLAKQPLEKVAKDGTEFSKIVSYAQSQHPKDRGRVTAIEEAMQRVWGSVLTERLR